MGDSSSQPYTAGEWEDLPIDRQRLLESQAKDTIGSPLDAFVELITNSDDAYKSLGENEGGRILLHFEADHKRLVRLAVRDEAGGMTVAKLDEATTFSRAASNFADLKGIRGFFGRGLKEAIIALGSGRIVSRHHGTACETEIRGHKRRPPIEVSLKNAEDAGLSKDGTAVMIEAVGGDEKRLAVPNPERLLEQLGAHFALRDICRRRDVSLTWAVTEKKGRSNSQRRTNPSGRRVDSIVPAGELRVDETVGAVDGADLQVRIWEAQERLPASQNDPCSLAGFIVTSEGVPLALRLFMDGREDVKFFFGTVECAQIAESLRRGEGGIVSTNRGGLDWRTDLCKDIAKNVEALLRPLIEQRESGRRSEGRTDLRNDVALLNRLAKLLDTDTFVVGTEGPVRSDPGGLERLAILPSVANVAPGEARVFGVYLPSKLVPRKQRGVRARVTSDPTRGLEFLPRELVLSPITDPCMFRGSIRVTVHPSSKIGDTWFLVCEANDDLAIAEIIARDPGEITKDREPSGSRGGLFKEISIDLIDDPSQRTYFDPPTGVLKIFAKFSGLKMLDTDDPRSTPESRTLYGELLIEGLCRAIAQRQFERGDFSQYSSAESAFVGAFVEFEGLRKRIAAEVHRAVGQGVL
jgi:hypothetical protein